MATGTYQWATDASNFYEQAEYDRHNRAVRRIKAACQQAKQEARRANTDYGHPAVDLMEDLAPGTRSSQNGGRYTRGIGIDAKEPKLTKAALKAGEAQQAAEAQMLADFGIENDRFRAALHTLFQTYSLVPRIPVLVIPGAEVQFIPRRTDPLARPLGIGLF